MHGHHAGQFLLIVPGVGSMKDELRIVAKIDIPANTDLGFYGGFFSEEDTSGGYSWQLKSGGYMNGSDMKSGYLRYVNSPAHGRQLANVFCQ